MTGHRINTLHDALHFDPVRVKLTVDEISQIDRDWHWKICGAEDRDREAQDFRGKTARTRATDDFYELTRTQIFEAGVEVDIDGAGFVLKESIAPFRIS